MRRYSIIIPVKPGGTVAALGPLGTLTADPGDFEIIITEGCSPSRQRNAAAAVAEGEILYFLDDDSRVSPRCLETLDRLLDDRRVTVAGGPSVTPDDDTPLQKLFAAALTSLFGAGGVRNRYRSAGTVRETTEKELILCNLAFRRQPFLDHGGFDERLYPNEENELLDRIQRGGGKLIHDPGLAVRRSQRRTLGQFVRQMYSYGRGRARQTLIAGPAAGIAYAPLALLIYLAALPLFSFSSLAFLPLAAYLCLDLLFTVAAVVSGRSLRNMFLFLLFPLMHISNGIGLLTGFIEGGRGAERPAAQDPVLYRAKGFGGACEARLPAKTVGIQ